MENEILTILSDCSSLINPSFKEWHSVSMPYIISLIPKGFTLSESMIAEIEKKMISERRKENIKNIFDI